MTFIPSSTLVLFSLRLLLLLSLAGELCHLAYRRLNAVWRNSRELANNTESFSKPEGMPQDEFANFMQEWANRQGVKA